MKVTPLEEIIPALTDSQWAAAGTITDKLLPHLDKWFLVEDFPGPAPDISRLKAALESHVDTTRRKVEIKPDGVNYKVIIRELLTPGERLDRAAKEKAA